MIEEITAEPAGDGGGVAIAGGQGLGCVESAKTHHERRSIDRRGDCVTGREFASTDRGTAGVCHEENGASSPTRRTSPGYGVIAYLVQFATRIRSDPFAPPKTTPDPLSAP
jgi:hypothetical protein